jgi:UDP-N-acetylglucosamine--N-acetylmuramyl-(pentapeptide) pyrophosphoryl-undecaprenol N-acetylglucosamine transferase
VKHVRWLFYAVNGLGLGHLTRLLGLARQIRQRSPNAQFLFLTTSEAESLIWQEGFASVKVPSLSACRQSGLRHSTYSCLLHTVVVNTIAAFRPQVLVVDTFPAGSGQELLPVLRWDGRRIFIYREQRQSVCQDAWFQNILKLYDLILIPHSPEEVTLPVPPEVPIAWVGPMLIRSKTESLSRQEARQRLQLSAAGRCIYVGFGGGGDSEYQPLRQWVLEQAHQFPQWQFVYSLPPLSRTIPTSVPSNVKSISYYPLAECWSAFDAAISAVGYNTAAELLHHGVPTIWVPLPRDVDDQHQRAKRLVEQGAGWLVHPYDSTALQQALDALSKSTNQSYAAQTAQNQVAINGAEQAADYLMRWLGT